MAMLPEQAERERRIPLADKKHQSHRRMERWIRLQQFVYGLSDDYSYAICVKEGGGRYESHALVRVGWMNWFGRGAAGERQHSLASALLATSEAISSNPSAVVLHRIQCHLDRIGRFFGLGREKGKRLPGEPKGEPMPGELLAG
jgi:hypothetical protein